VTVVVDASALAEVVIRSERASHVEELLHGQLLIAPDLINSAPIRRFATSSLIDEMWSTRHNLTPHDAAYVVLARRARAALLTLDKRLMHAPALGVPILTIRDENDTAE
jgi:predicted nucleic acid-binding protein